MRKSRLDRSQPKSRQSEWSTSPIDGESRKGPFPPDNSDLKRRIAEDPEKVAADAKSQLHALHRGYHQELYAVLAMIYGIARYYRSEYKAWKLFFSQSFFHNGKRKPKARTNHAHTLRHVMNFVFDARSKQLRNRTGKYAAALQDYMQIGVPVHLVAQEIEKDGGIEKLYQKYLEREAAQVKRGIRRPKSDEDYEFDLKYYDLKRWDNDPLTDDLDVAIGVPQDGNDELGGFSDQDEEDMSDNVDNADMIRSPQASERGADPEGRPTIELEVTSSRQSRFLRMSKGREAVVYVTCVGATERGWQRLRVRKVTWKQAAK